MEKRDGGGGGRSMVRLLSYFIDKRVGCLVRMCRCQI